MASDPLPAGQGAQVEADLGELLNDFQALTRGEVESAQCTWGQSEAYDDGGNEANQAGNTEHRGGARGPGRGR